MNKIAYQLTLVYTCDVCGATATQALADAAGQPPPIQPDPPAGWRDVLGMTVCGLHRVEADLTTIDPTGARKAWRAGVEL